MADEARIRSSLQIRKQDDATGVIQIDYRSGPTEFLANVDGAKGPSPGAVTISTSGTNIDLSQLITPGLCRIMNLDKTNYIEYGIWDGTTFLGLGEVLPGETYVIRISRKLAAPNFLRMQADVDNCDAVIEAFEV